MSQLGSVSSAAPASTAEGLSTDSSLPKSVEREEPVFLSSSIGGINPVTDSTTPEGLEEGEGGNVEGSSKSTSPETRNENLRLEMENQQMTDELSHLKGLCNNIFSMMSNYEPSVAQINVPMESQTEKHPEERGGSSGGGAGAMDNKEDVSPMLFGVSIGAKRIKRNNEDESSHVTARAAK